MSAVENEVTRESVEFEFFGKKWSVPTKQRASHMENFRRIFAQAGNADLAMVHAYLSAEQAQELIYEVDPDRDDLDAFTSEMAKALGFKISGN